jgi:acetyltransferase EpsM
MRAEPILIWGAGGHGRVVADLLRAAGGEVLGFVDGDPAKLGTEIAGGGRVLFNEPVLFRYLTEHGCLPGGAAAVALGVGDNRARRKILETLGRFAAPALIHPSATASPSAHFGRGAVVFPGAVVNAGAWVGAGVIVNTGAIVEHDCRVGDGVHVSPRATLCGGVEVGAGSWICAGATLIPGVRVGTGATVGAGAVVIHDVPDHTTVVGSPAREISRRE